MSTEDLCLKVVREYPGGGQEVVAAEGPDLRMSLWQGPQPARFPQHPCLGRVLHTGRMQGEWVWLESRPAGTLLCDLEPLSAPELAQIGAEVADALHALDKWSLSHGRVSAGRVVIGGDGRPQLLGTQSSGESDLVALRRLLEELWPESVTLLESAQTLVGLKEA